MEYSGSFVAFLSKLFLGFLIIIYFYKWIKLNKKLPPGPIGLPIVGYLPFLGTEAYITLNELAKKYGSVFSFYLGPKLVIVLGNYKAVKEVLSNPHVLDRPEHPPNHLLPNSTSLSVCNGNTWREQRQFSVQLLRQLGMGKSQMEQLVQEEIQVILKEIDSRAGCPMNLDQVLLPSISNNILRLLMGSVPDSDHPDRSLLNRMLQTMTIFFRPTRVHAYFPLLRPWLAAFKIWGYHQAEYYMSKFSEFIEFQINERKMGHRGSGDYLSGYLEAVGNPSTSFSERMLKGNFQSLFSAGSTPSRAALEWSLLAAVTQPGVQQEVQAELDAALGRERPPTWADHARLPYTLAVIYEVMRHCSIVPIAMLRCTSEDTKMCGFEIPKGTIVMPNIWGVHHDYEQWDEPFSFKPSRFIEDGKVIKPQAFVPFSYGKRNCPGEDMAIQMVFLYFASLLQRYTISQASEISTYKKVLGVAKIVILDDVCLKKRI